MGRRHSLCEDLYFSEQNYNRSLRSVRRVMFAGIKDFLQKQQAASPDADDSKSIDKRHSRRRPGISPSPAVSGTLSSFFRRSSGWSSSGDFSPYASLKSPSELSTPIDATLSEIAAVDACFETLVGVSDAFLAGIERNVEGAESGEEEITRLAALCVELQGGLEAYADYAEELAKMNQLLRDCVENDALRRWVGVGTAGILRCRRCRIAWN